METNLVLNLFIFNLNIYLDLYNIKQLFFNYNNMLKHQLTTCITVYSTLGRCGDVALGFLMMLLLLVIW